MPEPPPIVGAPPPPDKVPDGYNVYFWSGSLPGESIWRAFKNDALILPALPHGKWIRRDVFAARLEELSSQLKDPEDRADVIIGRDMSEEWDNLKEA